MGNEKSKGRKMASIFTLLFVLTGTLHAQNISDKEIKTNVTAVSNALEKLKQLEPITYEYDTHKYKRFNLGDGKKFGFLAENVQDVFPELVYNKPFFYAVGKNNDKTFVVKQIDNDGLIPVLVASIKELQVEVEKLKTELLEIKARK